MGAYVGVDLHRRRSVAVCLDEGGQRLWWRRFENSPQTLAEVVTAAGPDPEVVLGEQRALFRVADLVELARLVARIGRSDTREMPQ